MPRCTVRSGRKPPVLDIRLDQLLFGDGQLAALRHLVVFDQFPHEAALGLAGRNDWTAGAALSSDYQMWAERAGERPMSQKRLTQALEGRGFVQARTRTARGFTGIGLRTDVTHVTDSPVVSVAHARGRPI